MPAAWRNISAATSATEHVFMDVQDIVPGQDFAQAIENTISACQAVIVVIGPRWVADLKQRGGRDDFVLHEVSVALRRNVTVIPVLVGGATMPSAAELPENISALSRRQALEIHDARFEDDAKLLVQALRRVPGFSRALVPARRRMLAWIVAGAVLVIAASIGIARWKQRPAHRRQRGMDCRNAKAESEPVPGPPRPGCRGRKADRFCRLSYG